MKKILIMAYSLDVGGIEKSLISLLRNINYTKYKVTLLLQKKQGILLDMLPKQIDVEEYDLCTSKFIPYRKFVNRYKYVNFIKKNKDKYDFVCCYATYVNHFAKIACQITDNSCLYIHTDYTLIYKNAVELSDFFDDKDIDKFKKLAFISSTAMVNFNNVFNRGDSSYMCNNLIDGITILDQSNENVIEEDLPYFINVSRHDDSAKKLKRIIDAALILKNEGYKFIVYFIGDGPDFQMYKNYASELGLDNTIIFKGMLKNPYPYFLKAKALLLSSDYEGFPTVYLESLVLDCPIITTFEIDEELISLDNSNSIIVERNSVSIANAMKKVLCDEQDFDINFDFDNYNEKCIELFETMVED